jgi:hypothetical protein
MASIAYNVLQKLIINTEQGKFDAHKPSVMTQRENIHAGLHGRCRVSNHPTLIAQALYVILALPG